MIFALNAADDRPIYAQVVDQVKFAVAAGVLRPGDLVPSVRELSRGLLINPNTAARAYRDLQGEGLLAAVRGTGLQVTELAPGRCRAERREIVRHRLRGAMEEARRSRLNFDEIEQLIREEWGRAQGDAAGNGDVATHPGAIGGQP